MPGLRGPSALLRLQSDERLIALTRKGNHAAFEALCTRYQARLLAFCRHMLSSKEDAEDVLQEVFAAAFNAVLADEREINVRPWLYRIARNRSLNHLRRTTSIGVDTMDVHFAEGGLSTTDKVMRRENFRELIADVQELPETQRTALLLREIDALSYEQIAHAMETTVPSVKSLLVRARISLAEAAEARKLSCEEVRVELGEAAEGLGKISTPARRHVRGCERCRSFRKQLRDNNKALAAIFPVAPLFLAKKLLLAKLGSTASAGGAHVAGGAGAGIGAGASAGAGAGAAAGGGAGLASGVMTAGAGAIATKAVAGLAAAAIVTAGAVAVDHSSVTRRSHGSRYGALAASAPRDATIVVHQQAQPASASEPKHRAHISRHRPPTPPATGGASAATKASEAANPSTTTATTGGSSPTPGAAVAPATSEATEVTTETTQLPPSATAVPVPATTQSS
ncbi:MAG TPA: sigma-70 family RNA polymerase sigma factor, partial [Solirubrobacteraceae bacterium]|nr:sigma-70 family RNA polymerase sigma factor [Solirubrobacteraceae bacterium]